jgi:hypothetical protein
MKNLKSKKLNLNELKVQSFITSGLDNEEQTLNIRGGLAPTKGNGCTLKAGCVTLEAPLC